MAQQLIYRDKFRHPSLSLESSLHFSATRHRNRNRDRNRDRNRNRNEMTPDNDPDFDSDPVATRYAAMGPGQEPEPGKSVNRKMKDAKISPERAQHGVNL